MSAAKANLNQLLQHPAIWRAADAVRSQQCRQQQTDMLPSGYQALDQVLPGGGLPTDDLVEILCPHWGCGETELLSSALARLSQQARWLVWVNPPWLPYAPALQQQGIQLENTLVLHCQDDKSILWAMEQCLGSGACSAVQGWPQKPLPKQIRRLQLAAQKGHSLGLLMRPDSQLQQPSPAPLRLQMGPLQQHLQVRVAKCKGHWGSDWLRLNKIGGPLSETSCALDFTPNIMKKTEAPTAVKTGIGYNRHRSANLIQTGATVP